MKMRLTCSVILLLISCCVGNLPGPANVPESESKEPDIQLNTGENVLREEQSLQDSRESTEDGSSVIEGEGVQVDVKSVKVEDDAGNESLESVLENESGHETAKPSTSKNADNIVIVAGGAGGAAAVVFVPDAEEGSAQSDLDLSDKPVDIKETVASEASPKIPRTRQVGVTPGTSGQHSADSVPSSEPTPSSQPTQSQVVKEQHVTATLAVVSPGSREPGVDIPKPQLGSTQGSVSDQAGNPALAEDSLAQPSFTQMALETSSDTAQATDALQFVRQQQATQAQPSQLPEGVGGMAVELQYSPRLIDLTLFQMDAGSNSLDVARSRGEASKSPSTSEFGEAGAEDEDFPTFDKWSAQYLAEQEKQKTEKVNSEQGQVIKTSQKKLRQNFAASGCGAKVVTSNSEAENTKYLLNGNPDEYMINPCKAKKWFVVELCEPLQVHKVELGTLELFSSQPKSFRLSASQRFPTKEWRPLGMFELTPERTVQSFNTLVIDEYVKFIRVDMLEHHGGEHYCPITTLRILGLDMASEEDDDTDHDSLDVDSHTPADTSRDEDEMEESVNLFTSAKDTVVKLVKKVLYKGEDIDPQLAKKESHEGDDSIPPQKEASGDPEIPVAEDNLTSPKLEEKDKENAESPCSMELETPGPSAYIPEVGVVSVPVPKEAEDIPIVTKLRDTEQLPSDTNKAPVVIKLPQEDQKDRSLDVTGGRPKLVCQYSPYSTYMQMMSAEFARCQRVASASSSGVGEIKVPPDSGKLKDAPANDDAFIPEGLTEREKPVRKVPNEGDSLLEPKASTAATLPPEGNQQSDQVESSIQHDTGLSQPRSSQTSVSGNQNKAVTPSISAVPSQQPLEGQTDRDLLSSQSTTFTYLEVSTTTSETLEPSSLSNHAHFEAASIVTPGLDIQQSRVVEQGAVDLSETIFLKVSPSPTMTWEDSMERVNGVLPESPTSSESPYVTKNNGDATDLEAKRRQESSQTIQDPRHLEPSSSRPTMPDKQGPQVTEGSSTQSSDSGQVIDAGRGQANATAANAPAADDGKPQGKSMDLVKVGITSNTKRDISIMKLSNRIVALEQNVSMTKRYLEELSRAFKQQNEDMMKLLNKTISRLGVYATQSEDRDLQHQYQIDALEEKTTNLTHLLDAMQSRMDAMGKELSNRQFLLGVLQVFLFAWLLISSTCRRPKPALTINDHQFLLDTMPRQPHVETGDSGIGLRRNSDSGLANAGALSGTPIKRQISETFLATAAVSDPPDQHQTGSNKTLFSSAVNPGVKRKKKKKTKQHMQEGFHLPVSSSSASLNPVQTPSFSSSAGVLFGTGAALVPTPSATNNQISGKDMENDKSDKENQREEACCCQPRNQPKPSLERGAFLKESAPNSEQPDTFCRPSQSVASCSQDNRSPTVFADIELNVATSSCAWPCSDTSKMTTPTKENPHRTMREKESPEFKLPSYHVNKIRRLGEANYNNSSIHPKRSKGMEQFSMAPSYSLSATSQFTDFVNPLRGGECFLCENYLSENRFKFPASPTKDVSTDTSETESLPSVFRPVEKRLPCRTVVNGHVAEKNLPNRTVPIPTLHSHSAPSSSSPFHSSPSVTFSSPPFASKPGSPSMIPSFISFDYNSGDKIPPACFSASNSLPSVQALSPPCTDFKSTFAQDTKAKDLPPTPTVLKDHHPTCTAHTTAHDTLTSIVRDSAGHRGGKKNQPGHRRQGSFPLDLPGQSKNMEKDGRRRQGSFEGPKPSGKVVGHQVQGSKVKKSPLQASSAGAKGSSCKPSSGDSRTTPPAHRKGT